MTVEIPARMRKLPIDKHNRIVPWFVMWNEGVPDHRVIKAGGIEDALRFRKCWVCGGPMPAKWGTFVVGPMCAVNRVSAEPPSHPECANYSAQVCPFLTTPQMVRRENNLPEAKVDPAGIMIPRNPGVTLVWTSRTWTTFEVPAEHGGGTLFDIGNPTATTWYARGRLATRDEVLASIDSGVPALRQAAEEEGADAIRMLDYQVTMAKRMAPAE